MPTIFQQQGFDVMIHTDDHHPPHVHFYKENGVIVVWLNGARGDEVGAVRVRRRTKLKKSDQSRALRIARHQYERLTRAWEEIHG